MSSLPSWLKKALTVFEVSSMRLDLHLGLWRLLVQAGALNLQVVDHGLVQLDGRVLADGVVEADDVARGLRVLGRQGDHHVLVQVLGRQVSWVRG